MAELKDQIYEIRSNCFENLRCGVLKVGLQSVGNPRSPLVSHDQTTEVHRLDQRLARVPTAQLLRVGTERDSGGVRADPARRLGSDSARRK